MSSFDFDCVVIGAGVVGLAVARGFARAGHSVLVLEEHDLIGSHTSSRNSEVIHAGIYYPANSLKTRLCIKGNRRLYEHCAAYHVAHRRVGKWIVATSAAEEEKLAEIHERARAKGVDSLSFLPDKERSAEANLSATAVLSSPDTGIIDSHGLMESFVGDLEDHGGMIAFNAKLVGGDWMTGKLSVEIEGGERQDLRVRMIINCAGLYAAQVAQLIGMEPPQGTGFRFAKGNYCSYAGRAPFDRLIYPVPEGGGLGVHFTMDLGGGGKFGPNVEWLDVDPLSPAFDYDVRADLPDLFAARIGQYFPGAQKDKLLPAYSGIRPKVTPAGDFIIDLQQGQNETLAIGLYGIESPGLTSSLALADHVLSQVT